MPDMTRTLYRLCDELEDTLAKVKSFGFGIISTEPCTAIASRTTWETVASLIPSTTEGGAIILEVGPKWLEPFPDGTGCVRWFGHADGVAAFAKWSDRAGDVLTDLGVLPNHSTTKSVARSRKRLLIGDHLRTGGKSFRLLRELALATKRAYPEVVQTTLLDQSGLGSAKQRAQLGIPCRGRKPINFDFVRLPPLGETTIAGFRSLCRLRGEPRLTVDVKDNSIVFDGRRHALEQDSILIIDCLVKAGGSFTSRSDWRKEHPNISAQSHLERILKRELKRQCPQLLPFFLTDEKKRGYYFSKEILE
jgi:hypothetical protein